MQTNKLRTPLILWPFSVYLFFFLSQLNFSKEKSHLACFQESALILVSLLQPPLNPTPSTRTVCCPVLSHQAICTVGILNNFILKII